ncbi:hypothetical protein [Gordonia sp. WA4-43]|uniref:hypothetical protein n=1 Tax=Gordonia sp. WA4-43 TaxID=2878678 RepID=UPI001CF9E7B3|nr:hypothetical protein [Gordonia sp. WA4-43]UCZ89077.1 hypothetical protein LEL84_18765 [Gordonia sp. WA4-43]
MPDITYTLDDGFGTADAKIKLRWQPMSPQGVSGRLIVAGPPRQIVSTVGVQTTVNNIAATTWKISNLGAIANHQPVSIDVPEGGGDVTNLIKAAIGIPPNAPVTTVATAAAAAAQAAIDGLDIVTKTDADNSYAPRWQPNTAYAINDPVFLPNGTTGKRTAAGTSRATFDATELAAWTVASGGGTTTVDGLTDATTVGKAVVKASNAAAARSAIDAATPGQITTAINNLINAAPGALDTLDELAQALGDDPNFAATVTGSIAAKYTKPGGGIPSADLASAVQTLLALVPDTDLRRRFSSRLQRNTPQHQVAYWDKANTAAAVAPNFDVGGIVPSLFDNAAAGAALRVLNGFLTFAPTAAGGAAGYLSGDAGALITGGGLRWKWNKTGRTTDGGSICITLTKTKMTALAAPFPDAALHLVITPSAAQIQYITGGSTPTFGNIGPDVVFASALAQDNFTEHEVQFFRSGNGIRIHMPDGQVMSYTHAALADNIGSSFYIECYANAGNTDAIANIADAWVITGGVKAPSQQFLTRKTFDQLAAWEPVIKGMFPSARAVGQASIPMYITTNRVVGAVAYFLGTADGSGSMTVELRDNGVTIAGTSVTIAAGQTQGVATGPFTFITGHKITIHITAVGGSPGIGIDAQMIRP